VREQPWETRPKMQINVLMKSANLAINDKILKWVEFVNGYSVLGESLFIPAWTSSATTDFLNLN